MVSVSTLDAPKGGLIGAIALVYAATLWAAGLRGVSRINKEDGDAHQGSLVDNLCLQIGKCPGVQLRALTAASLYPITNALEFFKSYRAAGALRLDHDLLANDVVGVFGKTRFAPPNLSQLALGVLRAFLLQACPTVSVGAAKVIGFVPAEQCAIRISGEGGNAQVYPQHVIHLDHRWLFNIASHQQIPTTVYQTQIRLAALALQQLALSFTAHKLKGLSAIHAPDRHAGLREIERQDAGIVGDGSRGLKRVLLVSLDRVTRSHLRQTSNDHLRRQPGKLCATVMVGGFLQPEPVEDTSLVGHSRQPVASQVCHPQSAHQRIGLFGRGLERDLSNQLHITDRSTDVRLDEASGEIEILSA